MPATSSCPNCDALLDTSAFPAGTRMACADCGKPFVVGDTSRSASAAGSRRDPDSMSETPYRAPPTAQAVPKSRSPRANPVEDDSNAGRWVAFGICLFLLVVVLAGVGFLVYKAQSEGGTGWGGGATTAPARPPRPPVMKDFDDRQKGIEEQRDRIREEIEKERFEKERFDKKQ